MEEVLPVKRIAIPDAETFIAAIQDEISGTREGRYFHRLHVVLHVLHGASSYEAARLYGDSPRSVEYWAHRLLSQGLAGLARGSGPYRVITQLAVYGFDDETKRMKLISLHPGVSIEQIKSSSQFEILMPEKIERTRPPSPEDCAVLREIDPLGISLN